MNEISLEHTPHLNPTLSNVNGLVMSVIAEYQHQIDEHQIELDFIPSQDLPVIYLDTDYMQSALKNLLTNAVHYTPHKGSIGIKTYMRDTQLIIIFICWLRCL
jgi:signal transduction histidine kinase